MYKVKKSNIVRGGVILAKSTQDHNKRLVAVTEGFRSVLPIEATNAALEVFPLTATNLGATFKLDVDDSILKIFCISRLASRRKLSRVLSI